LAWAAQLKDPALKSLSYLARLFRRDVSMKQFSAATKPFSVFEQISGNSDWLSSCQRNARRALDLRAEIQMRTISFILAFAFILAGPSMAGPSDSSLPGTGTFSYNGSQVVTSAPAVLAAN
jgi:hypothetical protein